MAETLDQILLKYRQSLFRTPATPVLGKKMVDIIEALKTDYTNAIDQLEVSLLAYIDAQILANTQLTDSLPNKSGGAWGTISYGSSDFKFNTSQPYKSGSTKIYKNGQLLLLGLDYQESDSSSGEITFTVKPFSTDKIIITYLPAP